MPSAVVISSSHPESIETEVHYIRPALRESSFRQPTSAGTTAPGRSNDTTTTADLDTEYEEEHQQRRYTVFEESMQDAGAPSDEDVERQPRVFSEGGRVEVLVNNTSNDSYSKHSKSFDNETRTGMYDSAQERSIDDCDDGGTTGAVFLVDDMADTLDDDDDDDVDEVFEVGGVESQCEKGSDEFDDTFEQSGSKISTDELTASFSECDPNEKLPVVLYQDGATTLFNNIEAHDWEAASRTVREHPEQAKIWVVSTKSQSRDDDDDDDDDNWNIMWKRLPIHEAIRQQAPMAFVDQLLQVYTVACRQRTHFGSLPLHLALDHGSSPEIVHLILLHHILAFQSADQSGRMPLEILNDAESMDPADVESLIYIFRSVKRTWQEIQAVHDEELKQVQIKYTNALQLEALSHATMVKAEIEKESVLKNELVAMNIEMQTQKESYDEKFRQLEAEKQELIVSLKASQLASTETIAKMEEAKASHQLETKTLLTVLNRALDLKSPHWNEVQMNIEESMQTFETLEDTLLDHQDDLEVLLQNIGLEPVLPPPEMVDSPPDEWSDE